MRIVGVGVMVLLLASAATASVRLIVKTDGRKVISNVGFGPGQETNWNWLAKQHDRRTRYDDLIDKYSEKYDVDPVLVRAVIQVESNFNPRCVSNKGARGLMQLMPGTAKRYGVTVVHDAEQNIKGGVHYLSDLLQMFGDDLQQALAAYNAGEGAVQRYGGIPPYDETSTYVDRALTVYYGKPYRTQQAVSFAGKRAPGKKLRGGFGASVAPVTAALIPGMRYLGTN
jgi:soluble lytic murein transglycosylase-like protein